MAAITGWWMQVVVVTQVRQEETNNSMSAEPWYNRTRDVYSQAAIEAWNVCHRWVYMYGLTIGL